MIGIYKITKKENQKTYIGQSNDIERRFEEHKTHNLIPIDMAIQKYGSNAFEFSVIEECSLKELDDREKYWIAYYNTFKGFGYNCNEGGSGNACENNANTKLSNSDVEYIRNCYNEHKRRKEVYELFKDRITFSAFASIWDGRTWKTIKPEVYTEENKQYYQYHVTDGEASEQSLFSDKEVYNIRKRYVYETAKKIYEDYKQRCSFQTLQQILWGRTYKNVPIYKKKIKEWVNN